MHNTSNPGVTKNHQLRTIWFWKLLSQSLTMKYVTGTARRKDKTISLTYSLENIKRMFARVAPNTLRIATSFPFLLTTKVINPYSPRHPINKKINENN